MHLSINNFFFFFGPKGHTESVLSVAFSPDSGRLASGSGDHTVRFWDINTETPHFTCEGHKNWVLCIAWSPDGSMLASGSMDNEIKLWNPLDGTQIGKNLKGHSKWITRFLKSTFNYLIKTFKLIMGTIS